METNALNNIQATVSCIQENTVHVRQISCQKYQPRKIPTQKLLKKFNKKAQNKNIHRLTLNAHPWQLYGWLDAVFKKYNIIVSLFV